MSNLARRVQAEPVAGAVVTGARDPRNRAASRRFDDAEGRRE